ncbi:adhesive plaque matrix protein-like [Dorcoceras hygrometricum]|uniref:Adhesive plaque matrix protein-like n=1 Tax=Dorcoceras hygrometricum TaxID=472368 RepID=A0A2Z7BWN1_9LAMI|nr:adhesive plaque matrix protein-like [Dorcoceras hygrometricum]
MRGSCSVPEDDFGEGICLTYFRRLPSIPTVVLSVVGSAKLPSFSSFDYYPFEAVERLEEESVKLLVYEEFWRNLTAHPLALFEPFAYFRRLPSIPAVVLSVVGSAELPSFSSFDYYPFEAVERLEEESVKLLVYEEFWRNLTAHPLALFEPFASRTFCRELPKPGGICFD